MTAATAAPPTMRELITDALDLARLYLADNRGCADCAAGGCCPDHEDDLAVADKIDRLRRQIQAADLTVFEANLTAALRGTEEAA